MSKTNKEFALNLFGKEVIRISSDTSISVSILKLIFLGLIVGGGFLGLFISDLLTLQWLFIAILYLMGLVSVVGIFILSKTKIDITTVPFINTIFFAAFSLMVILLLNPNKYDLLGAIGFPMDAALSYLTLVAVYIFLNIAGFTRKSVILTVFSVSLIGVLGVIFNSVHYSHFILLILLSLPYSLDRMLRSVTINKLWNALIVLYIFFGVIILFEREISPIYYLVVGLIFLVGLSGKAISSIRNTWKSSSKDRVVRLLRSPIIYGPLVGLLYLVSAVVRIIQDLSSIEFIIKSYREMFETLGVSLATLLLGGANQLEIGSPFFVSTGLALGLMGLFIFALILILFLNSGLRYETKESNLLIWLNMYLLVLTTSMILLPLSTYGFAIWIVLISLSVGVRRGIQK